MVWNSLIGNNELISFVILSINNNFFRICGRIKVIFSNQIRELKMRYFFFQSFKQINRVGDTKQNGNLF